MSNYFIKSIILLLFSAIAYAIIISPWYTEVRALYDHVEYLKEVISQVQDLNEKRDALQAEFNSIPPNKVALIRNAVPVYSPENVILFFLSLDTFIAQTGLPNDTPYSIGSEKTDAETAIVAIPIQFNFEKIEYGLLNQVVGNLQRWERSVRIKSVQIWSASDDRVDNSVRASIELEALFSAGITTDS